jgi:hypothetical protein
MVRRVCPKCKTPQYSAAEETPWYCLGCGVLLDPSLNEAPGEKRGSGAGLRPAGSEVRGGLRLKDIIFGRR